MRILTPDNETADEIVREMESRGYTLTGAETGGKVDLTADDFLAQIKAEREQSEAQSKSARRAKRWSRFWQFFGWLIVIVVVYKLT